ncbi:hypothetical protein NPIL_330071, partial [Nephila pilipes]
ERELISSSILYNTTDGGSSVMVSPDVVAGSTELIGETSERSVLYCVERTCGSASPPGPLSPARIKILDSLYDSSEYLEQ